MDWKKIIKKITKWIAIHAIKDVNYDYGRDIDEVIEEKLKEAGFHVPFTTVTEAREGVMRVIIEKIKEW